MTGVDWLDSTWPWFVWYFIGCLVSTIYFQFAK